MPVLYFLADVFINTFGITQPTPETRRRAAFFILALLILLLIAVAAAAMAVHFVMR